MILHLNSCESMEILKEYDNVLIDFYSETCIPCKMISNYLEELSNEHRDMVIVKINVNECNELFLKYDGKSIPMLLFFKNNKLTKKIVGFIPKSNIWRFYNE